MRFKWSTDPPPTFNPRHQLKWIALGILLLMLLTGCESEQDRITKYQATLPPDNGKIVEVNGEKFRIVYIGGVRFRFPVTTDRQFGSIEWNGQFASDTTVNGVKIHFYWPDIPRGKAPGTKWLEYKGLSRTHMSANMIETLVYGRSEEEILMRGNKTFEEWHQISPADYIIRDNTALGLRTFTRKDAPKAHINSSGLEFSLALPLDQTESWSGRPIEISNYFINFNYAPKVRVMIRTYFPMGTHWKDIYLGVLQTLNQYREDKP